MSIAAPVPARALPPQPAPLLRRATPRWWRDAAEVAFGASLVMVTGLWAAGGGIGDLLAGPAQPSPRWVD